MVDREPDRNSSMRAAEDLLAAIVDLAGEEQALAFAALRAAHPALDAELCELFELHRRLLGPPDPSVADGAERFGPFELLRPLGSGGMGTVWLARQHQEGAERLVALKMVRAAALFSKDARERFRREARAMFRVEHPGICPIYDVGEIDGTPYLAMRYVPGRSLAELIAAARAGRSTLAVDPQSEDASGAASTRGSARARIDAALALLEAIARALHAAHETGLVHRDVKPGNVMVTPQGEPVLLDFGLARATGEASDITVAGAPLGTPAYMSPEQVAGRHASIDRTTDVWSLGATAYECLTLEAPFRAESREALYRRILEDDPVPPRRVNPALPRELDVVLGKALAKDPARRYRSALDLAEDLAAVRLMLPTSARRASLAERTALWVRRNRAVSALLLLLAIAFATSLGFALAAQRRAAEAEAARRLAEDSFGAARLAMERVVRVARDELARIPGGIRSRREMLAAAIAFHERFVELRADDERLASEVLVAFGAIAELEYELGEFAAAERALLAAERLAAGSARSALATTPSFTVLGGMRLRGAIALRLGRDVEGLGLLDSAVHAARARLAEAPWDEGARWNLQLALSELADHHLGRGELAAAQQAADAALATVEEAHGPVGDEGGVLRARFAARVAMIAARKGDTAAASAGFEAVIPVLAGHAESADADPEALQALAAILDARSELLLHEGRTAEGLADRRAARAVGERLYALAPQDHRFVTLFAATEANLGAALMNVGELAAAREHVSRGRRLFLDLVAQHHEVLDSARQALAAGVMLGNLGLAEGDPAAALADFESVVAAHDAMPELAEDRIEVLRSVVRALASIGRIHRDAGRIDAAAAAFARAEGLLAPARRATGDDLRLDYDAANLAADRAMTAASRDENELAASQFAGAASLWRALQPADRRAPQALVLAVLNAARAVLAESLADPASAAANARAWLAWFAAFEPATSGPALAHERCRCDVAALRLLAIVAAEGDARARAQAALDELQALTLEADVEWLLALRALARLALLESTPQGDDAAARARRELVASLSPLGDAAQPLDESTAPIRTLLHVLVARLAALPASADEGLATSLAALRERLRRARH